MSAVIEVNYVYVEPQLSVINVRMVDSRTVEVQFSNENVALSKEQISLTFGSENIEVISLQGTQNNKTWQLKLMHPKCEYPSVGMVLVKQGVSTVDGIQLKQDYYGQITCIRPKIAGKVRKVPKRERPLDILEVS